MARAALPSEGEGENRVYALIPILRNDLWFLPPLTPLAGGRTHLGQGGAGDVYLLTAVGGDVDLEGRRTAGELTDAGQRLTGTQVARLGGG